MKSDGLLNMDQYCGCGTFYKRLTDDRGTFAKNSWYLSRAPTSALFPWDLIKKKAAEFARRCP